MSVAFWSAELKAGGKVVEVQPPLGYVLNVQMASLGASCASDPKGLYHIKAKSVDVEGEPIDAVLCTLQPAQAWNCNLGIVFSYDVPVHFFFEGTGKGSVHLTGYYQPGPVEDDDEDDEDDMMFDEDDEDEDDEDEEEGGQKVAEYKKLADDLKKGMEKNSKLVVDDEDDDEDEDEEDSDDEEDEEEEEINKQFIEKMIKKTSAGGKAAVEENEEEDDSDDEDDDDDDDDEEDEDAVPFKFQKSESKGKVVPPPALTAKPQQGGNKPQQGGNKPQQGGKPAVPKQGGGNFNNRPNSAPMGGYKGGGGKPFNKGNFNKGNFNKSGGGGGAGQKRKF